MNHLKKIIYLFVITSLHYCNGQNENQTAQDEIVSFDIKELIPKRFTISKIDTVNIDSDTEVEYIISGKTEDNYKTFEYWIKNKEVVAIIEYPTFDINYRWLADVDGDGNKEVIRAQGFEDGIDYAIFKLEDGGQTPLLYFNPALLDDRHPQEIFWAYPSDVRTLIIKNGKLMTSLSNKYERDGKYTFPENQSEMPFIFFQGKTTQPDVKLTNLKEPQNLSYVQLKDLIKATNEKSTIATNRQIKWKGSYMCNFLRMKEEFADPRAYGTIYLNIESDAATFKLDSYMEIVDKNLVVLSSSPQTIVFVDKDDKESVFTVIKDDNALTLTSNLLDKITGERTTYRLIRI